MTRPRILIVDDDARMRQSIRLLLSFGDFDLAMAADGREALAVIRGRGCDLVLLDLFLGDMTGYEVLEETRRHAPEILVIMITGAASVESAVKALRLGAYTYLAKPFEPEELVSSVQNALARISLERERKKFSEALRTSEKRFEELVESLPIGVLILQDQKVVYANPMVESMFGPIERSDVLEELRCLHPEDREKMAAESQRFLSGDYSGYEGEFRTIGKDEKSGRTEVRHFQYQAAGFDHLGRPGLLLILTDVSRTREMEKMLLVQSKMHSLGRAAAGLAHEIRNPLTGINSFLFSLRDLAEADRLEGEDLERVREICGHLQSASDRIERVIRRVLDFAKPGLPRFKPTSLNESIENAVALFGATLKKKGVRLELHLDPQAPLCRADPHLLEQVVLNLVDNAVQSLEGSAGEKIIRLAGSGLKQGAALMVADSGPGIPEDLRAEIFDPFFTTRRNGSGLGLSLVHRIVLDHGGSIEIRDGDLGGAEFMIALPLWEDSDA